MSQFGQKVTAVIDTESAFGVTIKDLYANQQALTNQVSVLLNDAPETLDTLNEIAAAIADDPAFFTTMSSANSTLQSNIDSLSASATAARAALQVALQTVIDANAVTSSDARLLITNRLDTLELDPVTKTYVDTAVSNLVDSAPGVLDTLNEIAAAIADDPAFFTTMATANAAIQADVDQNEADSDAGIASNLALLEAQRALEWDAVFATHGSLYATTTTVG